MNESLKYNLIGVSVAVTMVVIYTVNNKPIKIIAGISLIIALAISLIIIQRNTELTRGQKVFSWIVLIPLLSLIAYIYRQII